MSGILIEQVRHQRKLVCPSIINLCLAIYSGDPSLLEGQGIDQDQGLDRGVFGAEIVVETGQGIDEAQMTFQMIRFLCFILFVRKNPSNIEFAAAVCQQL